MDKPVGRRGLWRLGLCLWRSRALRRGASGSTAGGGGAAATGAGAIGAGCGAGATGVAAGDGGGAVGVRAIGVRSTGARSTAARAAGVAIGATGGADSMGRGLAEIRSAVEPEAAGAGATAGATVRGLPDT